MRGDSGSKLGLMRMRDRDRTGAVLEVRVGRSREDHQNQGDSFTLHRKQFTEP